MDTDRFSQTLDKVLKSRKNIPVFGNIIYALEGYIKYLFKYKEILNKNISYKDIHKGKRCFIIGNGPSLKEIDISKLRNEYTISVNSFTNTEEYNIIKPKYHVIVDYVRFDKNIPAMYEQLQNLSKLQHKPIYVFPVKYKKFLENNKLTKGLKIIYLDSKTKIKRERKIEFNKRIPYYANVNNVSLSLALYLGFKEIYLVGFDMTGFVKVFDENSNFSAGDHFYNSSKEDNSFVKKLQSERSNETFLSTYYETFRIFRYLNEYAINNRIKIYNATPGGILDVFPRVKYNEIFK